MNPVAQKMDHIFPIKASDYSLELVTGVEVEDLNGWAMVLMCLVIFDTSESGITTIRDVKEQEVAVCRRSQVEDPRFDDALTGWGLALEELFEREDADYLECAMPHELVCKDLLDLKRPVNYKDFEKVCWTKKRLGQHLAQNTRTRLV